MKVFKTSIPANSLIIKYLPADYVDSFVSAFTPHSEVTADDLQVAFWTKPPKWVTRLFSIRNRIVSLFGLKGEKSDNEAVESCIRHGVPYGLFTLIGKTSHETVVKLSDKHLDAYMSIYIEDTDSLQKDVYVTTVVYFHNWTGYLYFYIILPFHAIVVKGMLKYVLKNN